MTYLALYDIAGIQKYIFNTNKLSEIGAASQIVEQSLDALLKEAIGQCLEEERKNGNLDIRAEFGLGEAILFPEDEDVAAELIYVAGGNALVYYREIGFYKKVNRLLSEYFLEQRPGLYFYVCGTEVGSKETVQKALQRLFLSMGAEKAEHPVSGYRECFPMTRQCEKTGQPAEQIVRGEYVSAERWNKINQEKDDREKYKKLEDLSKAQRGDLIAVVHIDGNEMGGKLTQAAGQEDWGEALLAVRRFSQRTAELFESCYTGMVSAVETALNQTKDENLSKYKGETAPFRKIYIGGDDVTFVANGYLGVRAAEIFLALLERKGHKEPYQGMKITACAGVTVCKPKYPFYRAYQTALEACGIAKEQAKSSAGYMNWDGTPVPGNYLDYHILHSNLIEDVAVVRRKGELSDMRLFLRPYGVRDVCDQYGKRRMTVRTLWDTVAILRKPEVPRSKVKELRNAGREGLTEWRHALENFRSRPGTNKILETLAKLLRETYGMEELDEKTFLLNKTNVLFDAMEYLDLYMDLGEVLIDEKTLDH